MATTLIPLLISGIIVAYLLPQVMLLSLRKRLIDHVDKRKIHTVTASRLGGITFCPTILISVFLTMSLIGFTNLEVWDRSITIQFTLDFAAILILYLVGAYDDLIGVGYRKKFLAQILAATLIIASGTYLNSLQGLFGIYDIPAYIGIPMTLFLLVFITNAINLIDGIDGLASLLSIMALIAYGTLFASSSQELDSVMCFATAGALIPFCYSNILGIRRGITSKIFMGDSGSLVVGTILGIMAIKLWNISAMEFVAYGEWIYNRFYIIAYTMLMVPCFDVIRVIIHRAKAKLPLFKPDKNHIHHKFLSIGMSQRRALFSIIAINLMFMAINLVLSNVANITIIVIVDVVVWTLLHLLLTWQIIHMNK